MHVYVIMSQNKKFNANILLGLPYIRYERLNDLNNMLLKIIYNNETFTRWWFVYSSMEHDHGGGHGSDDRWWCRVHSNKFWYASICKSHFILM